MSESRNPSESRSNYSYNNTSSESRNSSESRIDSTRTSNNVEYNNLTDIDTLIEKLESEFSTSKSSNPRINQALEQRKQKIEELKRLREEARIKNEEEKELRKIEQENAKLDDAINSVKKLVKGFNKNSYSSESHDSGESRW